MTDTHLNITNEKPKIELQEVTINQEKFFKIANHDQMKSFFMSIVSDSNHWMFISSNGGLTAGRKNAEYALFPYYTDDKITEFADITGSKTIFQIHHDDSILLWEPFSDRFNEKYTITRNLYKSIYGNKIIFEEVFHDLNLTFNYQWNSSNNFGFVKKSQIINHSQNDYSITLLDGIQNIMPHGVSSDLQSSTSNLVDGYKRSEIDSKSGLGIFALSAIIVDKAEPSEALKANVAWSLGLEHPTYMLSSKQLNNFRKKQPVHAEVDVKGEKGAYFLSKEITLSKNTSKEWKIIANVNQNQSQIIQLIEDIIASTTLEKQLEEDIALGNQNLISLNAAADGIQFTADKRKDTRHFSNVLFNIMRGGIFDDNYTIDKKDFKNYIYNANKEVYQNNISSLDALAAIFTISDLQNEIASVTDVDFIRLSVEYLPLKFSRRHGDPSRPWNKFSINTRSEVDGSKILDYEGNWRDIFQNWEALVYAYPQFIDGMIFKFLNASTFDGYNPYRVTKDGFDWEAIEPDNPWSYIGYWGDHQIIYLLKFLEFIEKYNPGKLNSYFEQESFVYAAVPYVIKSYNEILKNPKDTIEYNHNWEKKITERKKIVGADGALLKSNDDNIYHVNFIEKILATVLAKMSNFIPEGGIWMNTQRPEWNDANNALVGNGVSMVTLYYLRRFLKFFQELLDKSELENIKISNEMVEFYHEVRACLVENRHLLSGKISDQSRKIILDRLGKAASDYRFQVYNSGFWGKKRTHSMAGLKTFTNVCLEFIDHAIEANQREDKLYHAYNLMSINNDAIEISHLSEMLEGQVAILSSGVLSGKEAVEILDALKTSKLYREDQNSYILYPNVNLPKFLEKNNIPKEEVQKSNLLKTLLSQNDTQILNQDIKGNFHFNGNFHNANDLKKELHLLEEQADFKTLVSAEKESVLQLFEKVFNHKAFTGRSGTFFAYEGLGSIYWHMVSKLHLAVQEVCLNAIQNNEDKCIIEALNTHYDEIADGIGIHKSPKEYGAFPVDPYSHTPQHRGAQQPGMTGQVKEDVLVRIAELGIKISKGIIEFKPTLLKKNEFLVESQTVDFIDISGKKVAIVLEKNSMAFSFCQVPIVYKIGTVNQLKIYYINGDPVEQDTLTLNKIQSDAIMQRKGEITHIEISITADSLR